MNELTKLAIADLVCILIVGCVVYYSMGVLGHRIAVSVFLALLFYTTAVHEHH